VNVARRINHTTAASIHPEAGIFAGSSGRVEADGRQDRAWSKIVKETGSGLKGRPQSAGAAFTSLEPKSIQDRQHEHFAVARVTRMTGRIDGFEDAIDFFVVTDDFEPDLPDQVQADEIAVFRVGNIVFLAKAAGLGDAQAMDVFANESLFDPGQGIGRDKGKQVFHD
jgi:hypothetical protein